MDLVLAAVRPWAYPGHQLNGKQVGQGIVIRPEGPVRRPRRPLRNSLSTLRPDRWLAIGQHRACAAAWERVNWNARARMNLSWDRWRGRATSCQNQEENTDCAPEPLGVAIHNVTTPVIRRWSRYCWPAMIRARRTPRWRQGHAAGVVKQPLSDLR